MFPRTILSAYLIVFSALLSSAEPIPVDRRFDVGSAIDSVTSVWYTVWTSDASHWYTIATAEASSWASVGMSYASEGISDASVWMVSHDFTTVTTDSVFTTVTSTGGTAETIVTSVGVPAATLATGSSGVVTTVGGSQFTVIASPTSTSNGAAHVHPLTLTFTPALTALLTVVGGTILGAWITF